MTYVTGFVASARDRDAYLAMARQAASIFKEHGALRVVETWGVNVPDGKQTDFRRAVAAQEGETIVFSWVEWPDRATCEAAEAKMMADERMQPPGDMPFDTKRMIWGGFETILDV